MTDGPDDLGGPLPDAVVRLSPSRLGRILDDRWNPVLVQEVRRALRGRFFRIGFVVALTLAALATFVMVARGGVGEELRGVPVFFALTACLSITLYTQVPFSAYQSMVAEWDDDSIDSLVLTRMRPLRIVLGKLFAALVQVGLYIAAFTPFVVLTFLMKGVGLELLAWSAAGILTLSFSLTGIALFLGALGENRHLRVVLMGALALVAGWCVVQQVSLFLVVDQFEVGALSIGTLLLMQVVYLIPGGYALIGSAVPITHPHENRSTALRAFTTFVVIALIARSHYWTRSGAVPVYGGLADVTVMTMVVLSFASLLFVTEPETMSRRVASSVPRSRFLAVLASPWMPGGGRGVLFLWTHLGLLVVNDEILHAYVGSAPPAAMGLGGAAPPMNTLAVLAAGAIASIYLVIPSSFLYRFTETPSGRRRVRIAMVVLPVFLILAPVVLAALVDSRFATAWNPANPAYLVREVFWHSSFDDAARGYPFSAWAVPLFFMSSLLFGVPRVQRGIAEVLAASRRRSNTLMPPQARD